VAQGSTATPPAGKGQTDSMDAQGGLEDRIRAFLAAGNALSANDLAASALNTSDDSPTVRYLYLLSLAAAGATQRALSRYEELAPPSDERNEDWLALPARLYKDLAFAGIDIRRNLSKAAEGYRAAHARTGGTFSGINAATLCFLCDERALGEQLANAVLDILEHEPAKDERERYFACATRAEALLLLGRVAEAKRALQAADALNRNDLTARSRTRRQLAQILDHLALDPRLANVIALPSVYLFDPESVGTPVEPPDADLASQLEGSPVVLPAPRTGMALQAAEQLLRAGGRLHVIVPDSGTDPALSERLDALLQQAESRTPLAGFMDFEDTWRTVQALRITHGLARALAARLDTDVHALHPSIAPGRNAVWATLPEPLPATIVTAGLRKMVGIVFCDVVGFSKLPDADIERYWRIVVPRFARIINGWEDRVLLRRTWGDALHIVTADPQSAAHIALGLLEVTRAIREEYGGALGCLEMRIGAHFAPAFEGHDSIENGPTVFGSQLSFTARVEPVTPPGTVYVTEPFLAELQLQYPGHFASEYAGEIPLAKKYGAFRLASLRPLPRASSRQKAVFTLGVTGHLGLDGEARARVSTALLPLLRERLGRLPSVRLLCGFAPGADLVLADVVDQAVNDRKFQIHALLASPPKDLIAQWLKRAAELGDPPSLAAQATVRQRLQYWLERADEREDLSLHTNRQIPAFQALAARLACEPDLLIAVVRNAHAGKSGGAAEVVAWRRDPSLIPQDLRVEGAVNPSRELILVDPDTGAVAHEPAAP
jgi:class 3 adenylate cyclase/tetratricopeptide (TPR) repeat protein